VQKLEIGSTRLLCTAEEAMQMLGLDTRQLYRLVERELLKKHPAFGYLVFKKKDQQAFASMS